MLGLGLEGKFSGLGLGSMRPCMPTPTAAQIIFMHVA